MSNCMNPYIGELCMHSKDGNVQECMRVSVQVIQMISFAWNLPVPSVMRQKLHGILCLECLGYLSGQRIPGNWSYGDWGVFW